ncbi:MAG: M20 family metallopeptidase, partial [Pseudomonadota bacterium]
MSSHSQSSISALLPIIDAQHQDFVAELAALVNIDSGSFTASGVNRVVDRCETLFRAGGWEVERKRHSPAAGEAQLGDLIVGRLKGSGRRRILLCGHTDTVFDEGTAAKRPFRVNGNRAFGPGVSDMKAGLLTGLRAVAALVQAGYRQFGEIVFLCNPDEEIGSPFSTPTIRELAENAHAVLVLEGANANGDVITARKGITEYRLTINGRAAHAGVEPDRGRSAIVEAAHKILALLALGRRWPGVTVNVGTVNGGTRTNVVPASCTVALEARSPRQRDLMEVEAEIERLARCHTVPDVSVAVGVKRGHRPMERSPNNGWLALAAQEVGAKLGLKPGEASTGGASDANTTAAMGVPTLDGLGPIGGGEHGPDEWLNLDSVALRVAILAGLVIQIEE